MPRLKLLMSDLGVYERGGNALYIRPEPDE
jgi:hypothetical protein